MAVSVSRRDLGQRFARGGGWWTRAVNQRAGSFVAAIAIATGTSPNQLSLLSAVVGVATSVAVLGTYEFSPYLAAVVGFFGWQIAYSIDCADGQVARATARASNAGAQIDLWCDFIVHLSVVAVSAQIIAQGIEGRYLIAAVVGAGTCWTIPLFHEALLCGASNSAEPPRERRPFVIEIAGTARDYGFHVSLLAIALAVGEWLLLAVLGLVAILHLLFLVRRCWVLLFAPLRPADG